MSLNDLDNPGWHALNCHHRHLSVSADLAVRYPSDTFFAGAMLDLVALAEPGPFLPRTIEMGNYLGLRQDGQLVAMAGERLHLRGYCEISAVCTHRD